MTSTVQEGVQQIYQEGYQAGVAAQQGESGNEVVAMLCGIFSVALHEASARLPNYSPEAARFFAQQGELFAAFAAAPTVTSVSPATDAADVPLDEAVVLGFSVKLDPETVNEETVYVQAVSGGAHLGATVVYDGVTTVTVTPNNGYSEGTEYKIVVTGEVCAALGLSMAEDWSSTFTATEGI